MKFQVKPSQAFLIFSMLFAETDEEREPSFSAAPIEKAPRDELERAGLIEFQTRGRRSHIVLTDQAWDWAANNLGVELPKTARAARLLSTVLKKLGRFTEANDLQLRDYVSGEPAPERGTPATQAVPAPIEDQVRSACLDLARGATKARVRLTDLRKRVGAPRAQLDAALTSMQRTGQLVLFRIENPAELTAADESAALYIAGNPRHLVYLEA